MNLEIGAARLDVPLDGLPGQERTLEKQGPRRDRVALRRWRWIALEELDEQRDVAQRIARVVDDPDIELEIILVLALVLFFAAAHVLRQREHAELRNRVLPEQRIRAPTAARRDTWRV